MLVGFRRLAVVAVGLGIAFSARHDVAWADTPNADSPGDSSTHLSSRIDSGLRKFLGGHNDQPGGSSTATAIPRLRFTFGTLVGATPSGAGLDSAATQDDSPRVTQRGTSGASRPVSSAVTAVTAAATDASASLAAPDEDSDAQTDQLAAVTASTTAFSTAEITTPDPPEPLSPIAKLAAVPGRIVNAVLQALDITASSTGPKSPLNFAPIDEALFAAFRRVESAVGLYETPVVQPVVAPDTLSEPGLTPTVSQFLDAASAEYVLGGTPSGLQPFTVDGKQMTSTNTLSGESAKAWVTPQGQIIIAYQGTTGGTNLLANPLIAVPQVAADLQVIFTDTTPQAFTDSLTFEQAVEAAAIEQGYSKSDIFVTGHSLGGWEAEYVAQQTGLGGIGFESPGLNTTVPGNGEGTGFINIETYGDSAAYLATDLPGLQPFMPAYVPGGGSKPHYGSIVMIGDPDATTPLINASSLWGTSLIGDAVFGVVFLGNFSEHHLPGMQAYNLDVTPDPSVVPWLGSTSGPIEYGYGDMTIPELERAAAATPGTLIKP